LILKSAYWTTSAFSSFSRENKYLGVNINHGFNNPAEAKIVIADPDGSIKQKYDSDATGDEIYVGSGRVKLYELDGTLLFDGRIMKATGGTGTVTLTCLDWLSQLNDERTDYDMRIDLNGSGLRESYIRGGLDDGTEAYRYGPYTSGSYTYLIDDNMSWTENQFNNKFLVFPAKTAGDITVSCGPINHAGADTMTANGWANLWANDSNVDTITDTSGDLTVLFDFRPMVTEGSLYNSITSAKVTIVFSAASGTFSGDACTVNFQKVSDSLYYTLGTIPDDGIVYTRSWNIPGTSLTDIVDSNGEVTLYIYGLEEAGQDPSATIYYFDLSLGVNTDAQTSAYTITDTIQDPDDAGSKYNCLKIATTQVDLSVAGIGAWPGMEYSIVDEVNTHINTIVTAGDPLVTLTTDVEDTSGITTRNFQDKTRKEMLDELSDIDASVYWLPLGTTQVKWKQTTDATATEILRDSDVLSWSQVEHDIDKMFNQAKVKGIRRGDNQITQTSDDATSQADYDITRTKVITSQGVFSDYDAKELGDAVVARDKTVHLYLQAELAGISDIRLGDYLQITSTHLGLSTADYTVTHWNYNSDTHKTTIRLHPRGTAGYAEWLRYQDTFKRTSGNVDRLGIDRQFSDLYTQTWTNP
jgi:hypothetical protein